MRIIVLVLLLLSVVTTSAKDKTKLKGKPATLEATVPYLLEIFDDTALYSFATKPEQVATIPLHFGLGMWMRNNWGLWRNSDLKKYFISKGIYHPDDMSAVILKSFHRYLNGDTIDLKAEAAYYESYWRQIEQDGFSIGDLHLASKKEMDSSVAILYNRYMRVGDTVLVGISTQKKKIMNRGYSSVYGLAVIQQHKEDDRVQVRLIDIGDTDGYTAEQKVGDVIDKNVTYCTLLPPKGWTRDILINNTYKRD